MTDENKPEETNKPSPETPKPNQAVPPSPSSGSTPAGESKPTPQAPKPAAPAPKKSTATPTPRPAAAAAVKRPAGPASPARRHFMITWLGFAWAAFAAATVTALGACLRFLYPNVLFEPKMSFKVGKPDLYEIGVVDLRWKEKHGIWIVRNTEGMYVLSTVCTHLGCTPSWLDNEKKFKCPCHGSGFYASGINFEGPAPRPLERFAISLADDGQVLIDKSKKFQYEKGEWKNPASFLAV